MMITKNDWLAAAEAYMADERERLGELPTPEEVVAYAHGELDENAANRVRAALVYEPALTDLLLEDVPDNVVPMTAPPRRSRQWIAAAAMVVIAVTALFFAQLRNPDGPAQTLTLRPSEYRGASSYRQTLVAGASRYHLSAPVFADRTYSSYRIALVRDGETIWDAADLQREPDDAVHVTIPGRELKPGKYTITLHGLGDEEPELLQTYAISVHSPQ
ncbi:MAG TPA: hypothetical protein VEK11_20995 [Thermoanaerobaculia bacterium]|nr:hypothetical protein [Thermoanaerobaculia bacterium]